MLATITLMFAVTAMTIIAFMVINFKSTPILIGQRWRMPGVGIVSIVRVLGHGAKFDENVGADINVMFRLLHGQYGFCRKSEIQASGQLLPFTAASSPTKKLQNETKTQIEIDRVIAQIRREAELREKANTDTATDAEFKPYKPPPGWTGRIYDAEIVPDEPDDKLSRLEFLSYESESWRRN